MNNQKGGRSSFVSGVSAWNRIAEKNAAEKRAKESSDAYAGLTSAQQQQQTVANIARQKVIAAYKNQSQQNYKDPTKQAPTPRANSDEWRKYHSAWQNYYQKYYGDYYGKAAKDYVERERQKMQQQAAEQAKNTAVTPGAIISSSSDNTEEETQNSTKEFKAKIQKKVAKRAKKMRKSRHFVPIAIGLSVLILGLLFQYNQVIIANAVAYMSPGGSETEVISALDPNVAANIHETPTLMIPKINVEVPVVFGAKNDVDSMSIAMSNGVANFRIPGASAVPGEIGNFAVSGHSAGNIYQQSDYKFIFSGLTRLGEGDLIYMDYNLQRYTYRITGTKTVDPSDVAALQQIAKDNPDKPMITLITCTPLGTSKYRLFVYGEQIYPNYDSADDSEDSQASDTGNTTMEMPKNDDPPLQQFWKWLTGQY